MGFFVSLKILAEKPQVRRKGRYPCILIRPALFIVFLISAALMCGQTVFGQTASRQSESRQIAVEQTKKSLNTAPSPAEAELNWLVTAAESARASQDPITIATANQSLIALALRELAQLRLLESAYPQAIELYRRSLNFEDAPGTRVDLAIAELQGNRLDESVADAQQAVQATPNDSRAWSVLGRAWAGKHDYGKASDALQHAVDLKPDIETMYSLAICLLQSKSAKDNENAKAIFEKMIHKAGDSGSLHVLFGRAYRDANNMPAAVQEFQRAVALDPKTPHAYYFLALAQMAQNEWKATPAIKAEFLEELEIAPRDYLANYLMGFIGSGEHQYESADHYLTIATEINPQWPEPWLYMGLDAYAQNDNARAEKMFRKAIELTGSDESRSNYQIRRAYVDLGRILANSGRTAESETYLKKARDLQNKIFRQSQHNVSELMSAGGAGPGGAVAPLSSKSESEAAPALIESADPFAPVGASVVARANLTAEQRTAANAQEDYLRSVLALGLNDLATSEAVRRDYASALGHYQEAEKWNAKIPGLSKNLGLSAYRLGNYPEAARGLSAALGEDPNDSPLRAILGMAYFGGDQYDRAVKTFTPLGLRGMQDATVGYAWAASLTRLGQLKQAADVLTEYENRNRSENAAFLIGKLWIEIGDYAHAVSTFHRVAQNDPTALRAHYFAGEADIHWEHWADAANEFQAELKLNSTDVDAKYDLGFVYLQQSRPDDALALFRQVVETNPDHANAQYELGKILFDHQKLPEAIEHFEAAARLSPQTDYVHYQLQAAYRKVGRTADADRELEIYKEIKAKKRGEAALELQQKP